MASRHCAGFGMSFKPGLPHLLPFVDGREESPWPINMGLHLELASRLGADPAETQAPALPGRMAASGWVEIDVKSSLSAADPLKF